MDPTDRPHPRDPARRRHRLSGGNPGQQCAASKVKAAGKKAACLLFLDAKVAGGATADPIKVQRCEDKLSDPEQGAFARAEARGGCAVGGDAMTVEGTSMRS